MAVSNLAGSMVLIIELELGIMGVLGIGAVLGIVVALIIIVTALNIVMALEKAVCTMAIAELTVSIEHFCLIQFF